MTRTGALFLIFGAVHCLAITEPAYDQEYLQQYLAQQQARQRQPDAKPIFEQEGQQQQQIQYAPQGQQIRLKDTVNEQVTRLQVPQHLQYVQQPIPQAQRQVQYVQQPQQIQQYVPQQQQYRVVALPQGLQQQVKRPRGPQGITNPQEQEQQSVEDYDPSPSYQFGFDVKDDEFTNYQNRKESRDGDVIKGSYSVVDSDGFIRTVTYTADPKEGFKAQVTREPTDIVVKVPTPAPAVQPQGLRTQQNGQYLQQLQHRQQPQQLQQQQLLQQPQQQKQRPLYQYQ